MLLLSTLLATLLPSAYAFSFSLDSDSPGSCSQVKVEWSGGTPPFYLTILVRQTALVQRPYLTAQPAYDYPSNVSLPDSAYNSGSGAGEYAWTVNCGCTYIGTMRQLTTDPEKTQLVAMMSDATGVAVCCSLFHRAYS